MSKSGVFGGDKRDRTADLLNAIHKKTVAALGKFGLQAVVEQ